MSADLPDPTVKLLYESDGQNDLLIGEGYDVRNIIYLYGAFNITSFVTRSNLSRSMEDQEIMSLKGNVKEQKVRFAIVSYPSDERHKDDQTFCMQNSAEHLRHLIDGCQSRIILRDLNQQERSQLQELKEEQKSGWWFVTF